MSSTSTPVRHLVRVGREPIAMVVAPYTRQSVDRGDAFGSCAAQRDAIEAFVRSQKGNGWELSPVRYDDGGYTGANTDRPAFQRVLADVRAGKIQVVATYRLDRLSRSQRDFFQIIDELEKNGATFVSVCEQFNTTTAQGRFALSISAAVAQLEREVTSQRTKDKIHASRRRGLWTGGHPILGYDAVDGRLVVNPDEADRVRAIFDLYLDRGSLLDVADELTRRGWTSKTRRTKSGELVPRRVFDKSRVHHLLTNAIYVGRMRLGAETFDGAHEAIVDAVIFGRVQELLAQRRRSVTRRRTRGRPTLLQGLLACRCGASLTNHWAARGPRRYGFYVCTKYQREGAAACPGSRVAVGELDAFVVARVRAIGRDPALVAATIESAREQLAAKKPELEAELQRLDDDRRCLAIERERIVAAIGSGEAPGALVARLGAIEREVAAFDQRDQELRGQLVALDGASVDEAALREALAEFNGLFAELTPPERARLLRVLIESVRFDGTTNEVAITFKATELKGLGALRGDER